MDSNEFMNWFGGLGNDTPKQFWSDEDELNSLWKAYDNFVQELKLDGYKVLRNEHGKHKLVKNI